MNMPSSFDGGESAAMDVDAMTHFPPLSEDGEAGPANGSTSNLSLLGSLFGHIFPGFANSARTSANGNPPGASSRFSTSSKTEGTILGVEAGLEQSCEDAERNSSEMSRGETNHTNGSVLHRLESKSEQPQRKLSTLSSGDALVDYRKGEFKRYWMPDSTCKDCYDCHDKFTAFKRRHHCRLCGQIFCAKCSNRQMNGAELGYAGVLRICNFCADHVDQAQTQAESTSNTLLNTSMNHGEVAASQTANGEFSLTKEVELSVDDQNHTRKRSQNSTASPTVVSSISLVGDEEEEHPFKCIEAMLEALLAREQICSKRWGQFLLALGYRIVKIITPALLKRNDALNPLDFVHIKKIAQPGRQVPSCEVIHGVAFTKALSHSAMPSTMRNVSTMLLGGGISYERMVEKLSAIDTVLLQEEEFLNLQIEKISSRRITLLLTEDNVAKTAADILLREGIALVTHVKRGVLERISASTGADIVASLDAQFLQPGIGFASYFRQRHFDLSNGKEKFILTLESCANDSTISVLLKGGSAREVAAAKRILKFLVVALFSSKLENAFLSLFNSAPLCESQLSATLPRSPRDGNPSDNAASMDSFGCCELCALNTGSEDRKSQLPSVFVETLRVTQLSTSTVVQFAPPYLETEEGRTCYLLPYFKSRLFPLLSEADYESIAQKQLERAVKEEEVLTRYASGRGANTNKLRHPMLNEATKGVDSLLSAGNWAAFRTRSSLLFQMRHERNSQLLKLRDEKLSTNVDESPSADVMSPYCRQRIAFLYCANMRKPTVTARSFCMGPYVLQRHFFDNKSKDTSLGAFLVGYCLNADYKCRGCERSIVEHLRRIVHRHARIEITTGILLKSGTIGEDFAAQPDELPSAIPNTSWTSIICWRRCPICASNSSITSLPDAVYHLSFAKFIDLLSNGSHCTSAIPSSSQPSGNCPHCTFHQHWHYFALRNAITCIKVHPIRPLHVVLSPMRCRISPKEIPCKEILERKYDIEMMAEEALEKADAYLAEGPAADEQLHQELCGYADQLRTSLRSQMSKFDPDCVFKTSASVNSNDFYCMQALACLRRSQCFLHSFITAWDSKPQSALHRIKSAVFPRRDVSSSNLLLPSLLSSASSTAALLLTHNREVPVPSNVAEASHPLVECNTEISETGGLHLVRPNSPIAAATLMEIHPKKSRDIPLLTNHLPREIHFELPINSSTTLVRDLLDPKGTHQGPDIGSMIAYALASSDYEERKLNKLGEGVNGSKSGAHDPPPSSGEGEQCYEVTFADSRAQYSVKVYLPEHFEHLRELIFADGEEQFLQSLCRTSHWCPQGGKSGASFYRTEDERFVIKQMSKFELESFKKCALNYLDYIRTAVTERKLTALCKMFGVYTIYYVNKLAGGSIKMDVLVMEYLFYSKSVKQLWDLKGSLRNRYATTKTEAPVLLDENLVQDLWGNQLYVHPHSKAALNRAIINDSQFLCSQGIMDYSLLAGISQDGDEVIVGIVDYMRTYTLDKKVESLVKTALPIAHSPTVVSPEQYCKRFYEAIDSYFAMSPDQWTSNDSILS